MKASRLATLAAAAALLLSFGGLPAAAQDTDASSRPVSAPPAARKTASTRAKAGTAKSQAHVYLFRGLMNIFSLGMDELADKIKASGIPATVYNHTEWEEVADRIAADYKNGNRGPIVLIGHSLGADAVIFMAESLGKRGVPVALVVPFDGTQTLVAPGNVARVMNITQRDYAFARRGAGFRGELQNIDVSSQGVDHLNIDKSPRLHAMVLNKIVAVVKKGAVPGEGKEQPKPAPKPAPAETAAKPHPAGEPKPAAEAPAPAPVESAAKAVETPKAEARPATQSAMQSVPPSALQPAAPPSAPAVTATASTVSTPPVAAPTAAAPKPVSAPVTAPVQRPATERLEYEKLVLPKH